MARVLGATRLSHDTDASTSIERQRAAITGWVQSKDHKLIHITEDTDVSGAIAPHDRGDLGSWLTGSRLGQWDVLVVAKLDRISRSLIDFVNLLEWLEARGKSLVSVGDSLDFSEPRGAFVGKILVLFAEYERQAMRERRSDAAAKLYGRAGYNGGGSMPWGYRPVRRNGHIELEPDPDLVPKITEIADAVIGGESVASAASRYGLDHASLLRRLRSPALKGVVMLHGEVVRGEDGLPLLREPVLPSATWVRLQLRLDANSKGAGVPRDASPWLHVLVCKSCGDDLYFQRWAKRPSYAYFTHKASQQKKRLRAEGKDPEDRCRASFRASDVEPKIERVVMNAYGDSYMPEFTDIPAEDHTAELAQVEESIADLEKDRYERHLFRGEAGAARYAAMMTRLEARAEELRAQPQTPAGREIEWSADTFAERWESLESDHERGALLRGMGVKLVVFEDEKRGVRVQPRAERPGSGHPRTLREWIAGMSREDSG